MFFLNEKNIIFVILMKVKLNKIDLLPQEILNKLPIELWVIVDSFCNKSSKFLKAQLHLSQRFIRFHPKWLDPLIIRRSPRITSVVLNTRSRDLHTSITLDQKRIYHNHFYNKIHIYPRSCDRIMVISESNAGYKHNFWKDYLIECDPFLSNHSKFLIMVRARGFRSRRGF